MSCRLVALSPNVAFLVLIPLFASACGSDDEPAPAGPGASGLDPAPGLDAPGIYRCPTCPDFQTDEREVQAGAATVRVVEGVVRDAVGDGLFYLAGRNGQENLGPLPTGDDGRFQGALPLFCGEQLLKCVWSNASGRYVLVQRIVTTGCVDADIRITLSWDALGRDFELHLIKPGGRINDRATDCTWNTCISNPPDWGVPGDASDDPKKDVDDTNDFGPENIFLAKPEAGTFHVYVEHWGNGDPAADGQVIVNLRGRPPVVLERRDLPPRHVWGVATIAWPAGELTPLGTDFDCTGSWSGGCTAPLPPR